MSLKDPNVSNPRAKKRIAMVIANPAVSTTTGWPVGFWWSELSHPYLAFEEAGYAIEIRDKHVMPWRIEDRLKELGANFVQAGVWRGFAVRDGNLITGQQNFSGADTAKLVIETLGR